MSNTNPELLQALKLVKAAYLDRTNENDPYHGGNLHGKEKKAWAKVLDNLENLAKNKAVL